MFKSLVVLLSLLVNPYGREHTSLNGNWNTIMDQYEVGVSKKIYIDRKPSSKEEFLEFSYSGSTELKVPGDWNHQNSMLKWYEGTVWYSRHFNLTPEAGQRYILYFAGVSQRADVYLNGKYVMSHEGAFTPFQADVTDLLSVGDNFISVRVNNNRRADAIPAMSFDWWNYGGITRDVMLVKVPQKHISDYKIALSDLKSKTVSVSVSLSQALAGEEVKVLVPELKINAKAVTDANGVASFNFKSKKISLWSPENPKLYDVIISTSSDSVQEKIGFRTISAEGTKILLNGKEIFLKSISFHEEIPMEQRRAVDEKDALKIIKAAKALGCNMIRLAHYPQNEYIVREAEKEGLIIWEEIPLWQGIDFSNKETFAKAKTYLSEMIERDKNRCAIGFWSISNETKPSKDRDAFLSDLLAYGKTLDSSRLFTSAFDIAYYNSSADRFEMKDEFAAKLDVIGINKYMGWYSKWPKNASELKWAVFTDKPLIITEFGGEAKYGVYGNSDVADSWSEDYQAELYKSNLLMFKNIPNLAGVSPWVLYDFMSPYRQHPVKQEFFNRKGLLSDKGERKKAWYIMREYYTSGTGDSVADSKSLYKDANSPIEDRVEDLLSRMTLKEKVLQLNQYTLGRNTNVNNIGEEVKNIPAETGSVIYFDENPQIRNSMQKRAMEESRLGIPLLFGFDVIHGFRTLYQISLGQACSWNPDLVAELCHEAAKEARSAGVDWTFSPMIDVARDPRWGRVAEGYGEDPYTNAVFAAASVRGYQGNDLTSKESIASCLKHYVGYGASEAGRDYVYTEISRQTLWDTYLPPYEAGVKAGAQTIMSSFNDIIGTPGSANHYTLTEILRDKWGFDGLIVSDWGAVVQLINQGYAKDLKEASQLAINAGLDMDMMSHGYDKYLEELVAEGKVNMSAIDEAVRRTLRVKFRLGLFENPYTEEVPIEKRVLQPSAMQAANRIAEESMVLLKNNGILPLSGQKKIAVIGPLAKNGWDLMGNWKAHARVEDMDMIISGLQREFKGKAEIRYAEGCDVSAKDTSGFAEAVKLAQWSDVVILCLGERLNWSGENTSRTSIALPKGQEDLLAAVKRSGKPVVVTLTNGRPLELCRIEPNADAILETWQPGVNGASAIAGIISGRVNPSGKLSITFPYVTGQIPIYYDRRKSGRRGDQGLYKDLTSEPLYWFGHGLSYTTFSSSDIKFEKKEFSRNEKIRLSVEVTNTGDRDGSEVALWYISDPYSSITRPVKELKHFEKKLIGKGEKTTFTFDIEPEKDLSFVNDKGEKFLESGEYDIFVFDKKFSFTITD